MDPLGVAKGNRYVGLYRIRWSTLDNHDLNIRRSRCTKTASPKIAPYKITSYDITLLKMAHPGSHRLRSHLPRFRFQNRGAQDRAEQNPGVQDCGAWDRSEWWNSFCSYHLQPTSTYTQAIYGLHFSIRFITIVTLPQIRDSPILWSLLTFIRHNLRRYNIFCTSINNPLISDTDSYNIHRADALFTETVSTIIYKFKI